VNPVAAPAARRAPYAPLRHRPARDRWSPALVVEALRAWTAELGRPPRRVEWSGEHAGRGGDAQRKWMREYPRWPSSSCAADHFGSWSAALEAAGLAARGRRFESSVAERVLEARRLAAAGLSVREIAGRLRVSVSSAYNYLAAAGCPSCRGPVTKPGAERCSSCLRSEATVPRTWTRDEVRAAVCDWHELTGSPPSYREWTPDQREPTRWVRESPRWPSAAVVCRLYAENADPWNAALRDAGLAPRARRWSDDAIRASLAGFWAAEGRPPRPRDLAGGTWQGPSVQTLRRRYGSLAAAWAALGPVPSG
jgi:Homing endonuclease associated repeat